MARGDFPRQPCKLIIRKMVQSISGSGSALLRLQVLIERFKWREKERH
jgi:hypothetical protein